MQGSSSGLSFRVKEAAIGIKTCWCDECKNDPDQAFNVVLECLKCKKTTRFEEELEIDKPVIVYHSCKKCRRKVRLIVGLLTTIEKGVLNSYIDLKKG